MAQCLAQYHRCGEGESWTVKGPDGACIGQSWTGDDAECDAEEAAQALNAAFELGRACTSQLEELWEIVREDIPNLRTDNKPLAVAAAWKSLTLKLKHLAEDYDDLAKVTREMVDLCALGDTDETTEAYGWGAVIKRAKRFAYSPAQNEVAK